MGPSAAGVTAFRPSVPSVLVASRPAVLSRQVGSDGVGGVAVQAVAGVVVAAGRAAIFVAGVVLHVAQGGVGVQTGRERFTNHAEWVSVTAGRWWHLPSSLRFFVALAATCWTLMQREWTQHPGI